jgi:hypothetical protein
VCVYLQHKNIIHAPGCCLCAQEKAPLTFSTDANIFLLLAFSFLREEVRAQNGSTEKRLSHILAAGKRAHTGAERTIYCVDLPCPPACINNIRAPECSLFFSQSPKSLKACVRARIGLLCAARTPHTKKFWSLGCVSINKQTLSPGALPPAASAQRCFPSRAGSESALMRAVLYAGERKMLRGRD